MKLKKMLSTIIFSISLILFSVKVFAVDSVREYNAISVCISKIMEILAVILGIVYFIFAVIYLIKTKDKNGTKRIKKLIIGLIITVLISIVLSYFAPIVKEIGMTYSDDSLDYIYEKYRSGK